MESLPTGVIMLYNAIIYSYIYIYICLLNNYCSQMGSCGVISQPFMLFLEVLERVDFKQLLP